MEKCSPGDKRGSFIKGRVKGQDDPSDQCGTILRLDETGTDETAPSPIQVTVADAVSTLDNSKL